MGTSAATTAPSSGGRWLSQNSSARKGDGTGVAGREPLLVKGTLDQKIPLARGEQQRQRADAVEVAVVAFVAKPIEKLPRIALRGASPEVLLPTFGRF